LTRWYYGYAQLHIASELCLPEWEAFAVPAIANGASRTAADVEVRLTRGVTAPHPPLFTAAEVRFHVAGIGTYSIQAGKLIQITLLPDAGERETRLFLLGSAWGALCYQRDILALHASVVEVQGQAVAFCGVSGAGKSSIAAWLVAQGYPLIGDDLCHFTSSPHAGVYPAIPRLKLWRNALDHLGWETEGLQRDHFRMEKFHVGALAGQDLSRAAITQAAAHAPVPLRAIYLLSWGELGIVRLTGLAALSQLIESATYRGELLEPMGAMAAHWQRCFALARHVPVYRFTRPTDWSAMPAAMQTLIATWHTDSASK